MKESMENRNRAFCNGLKGFKVGKYAYLEELTGNDALRFVSMGTFAFTSRICVPAISHESFSRRLVCPQQTI